MNALSQQLRKYFIMGSQNCEHHPVETLEKAILGGITAFQYREKGMGSLKGKDKLELGEKLRSICQENDVLFLVNDDINLAAQLDADGIHVGQDDMPIEEIRKRLPHKWIGLSVSTNQELNESSIEWVDYIGAGPIFSTTTKEAVKTPVGLEWIKTLRSRFPILPIVGIGGITTNNARLVIEAGADGVSVVSAITKAQSIKDTVSRL